MELLVEFGELANETKCFKFWSTKESKREKVLEEYIDCLFMILYFCNVLDISLDEEFPLIDKKDIIETFLNLYNLGIKLNHNLNKDNIKKLLVELINLSDILNFTKEDLECETNRKSLIIEKRLNSNY